MKNIFQNVQMLTILCCCAFNSYAQTSTKLGFNALANNTGSGIYNTAIGYYSLNTNTIGTKNTALGANTLRLNVNGVFNTATGYSSLYKNDRGNENASYGAYSMFSNINGGFNTAIGTYSLYTNSTGSRNTGVGYHTLYKNNGIDNTASGYYSLHENTTGAGNTATGVNSLQSNTTGYQNTSNGGYSLKQNTTGISNTAIGYRALHLNSTGSRNTAVGYYALSSNLTGSSNTAVGNGANVLYNHLINATAIGYNAIVDDSDKVRIGNTLVKSIGGQVPWTTFSDGRYKNDIAENVPGLAFINSLRPVTYTLDVKGLNRHYNKIANEGKDILNSEEKISSDESEKVESAAKISYNGFIAQEVEDAAKKINFNFSGVDKPENKDGLYGLRYDNFIAPLVKAVQDLSKQNEELKKELQQLKSTVSAIAQNSSLTGVISSPVTTTVDQNNPNPFISATVINYRLPIKYTSAKIVFTDNNGKTIKYVDISGSGKGSFKFDSSVLPSGTYNYTLYANEKLIGTKQMVIVK